MSNSLSAFANREAVDTGTRSCSELVAVDDIRRNRVQLVAGGGAKELHGDDGDNADQRNQKNVLDHGGSILFANKAAHKGVHDNYSFPIQWGDLCLFLRRLFNIAPKSAGASDQGRWPKESSAATE